MSSDGEDDTQTRLPRRELVSPAVLAKPATVSDADSPVATPPAAPAKRTPPAHPERAEPVLSLEVRHHDFGEFYATHSDPIYRALTLTLGDPVLAADATSEAMTKACQRWSSVRDGSNPPGWVYRVGLNWARSRWRKLRRERPLDHQLDEGQGELDPTATVVKGAVAQLPMPQRSIVVLRYYLQWTPTEIADSLDLPVGTVKSRLHRALAAMKTELGDDVDDFSEASSIDLTEPVANNDLSPSDVDLRSRQRSIGRATAATTETADAIEPAKPTQATRDSRSKDRR